MSDPEPLDLRPLDAADLGLLRAWLRAAGLDVPQRVDPGLFRRRLLGDGRILMRTGELRGRPVGFVRLDLAPDRTAELTVIVDPARRRQGLGRALLRSALEEARRRGLRRLFAVVSDGNPVGHAFFVDAGFAPSGNSVPGFAHLERHVHRSDLEEPLEIVP